MCTGN